MNTSFYAQLQNSVDENYPNKIIMAHVVVIKRTKSLQAQQATKYKLFFIVSKLVIKAINNFNHLTRTIPKHKILHSSDDIAMECYVAFDTCIRNVEMKDLKKFYFYLNTALNRAVYRLFEKQYKRYFNIVENTEENSYLLSNAGYNQHFDFSEIDLSNFSELELNVLKFKLEGGKINTFLKQFDIPNKVFYETFEIVKGKLTVLYKEENYFQNKIEIEQI